MPAGPLSAKIATEKFQVSGWTLTGLRSNRPASTFRGASTERNREQVSTKESARRVTALTDQEIMIICGGGWGKPRQAQLIDDIRAMTQDILGPREILRVQLNESYDPTRPNGAA